jgi:hypothetical protein
MYKIIGADQREYGPVGAEPLRQWIGEGRANAQTLVRAEGSNDWKPLSAFPEFAEALGAKTAATPPPRIGTANIDTLAADIIRRDYQVDIGDWFSRGWNLVKANFWLLVGATTLVLLVHTGIESIPFLGHVAGLLLMGVLFGGLYWVFLQRLRGRPADLGDAFAGFSLAFLPLMLAGVLYQLLGLLGLILCIAPGVYLLVSWDFALLLVIDKNLDFWPALELSRKVVHRHWWPMFGFFLVQMLVFGAGLLALLVGVFVTGALATAAGVCAYEDIFCAPLTTSIESRSEPSSGSAAPAIPGTLAPTPSEPGP